MLCVSFTALLVAVAAGASASSSPTPQQMIDTLNAIRSSNGIPNTITLNSDWSAKCAKHNHYMAVNQTLTHDEDPSKPAYTDDGNWCGTSAVLAGGSFGWGAMTTPWDDAPIHLMQMLSPQLVEAGAADSEGFSSFTTWPGYEEVSANDALYVFPGDGKTVQSAQLAAESPFTPQTFVGIPESATTGPYLYVLADGPWTQQWPDLVTVSSASLIGPTGPVEVKTVDESTQTLGDYLPAGAMIIPVKPLQSGATYTAQITLSGGGDTLTKSWMLHTALNTNAMQLHVFGSDHRWLLVAASSSAGNGVVTIKSGAKVLKRFKEGAHHFSVRRKGVYKACMTSGGGTTGFQVKSGCLSFRVRT